MCSYFKNLWSLSPSGDGLRVTSVALVSQILFAPLRLGVLAIKMKRKVAKTPSRKVSSQHRSRRRTVKVSLRTEVLLAAISYCDLRLIALLTAASSYFL